VLDQIAQQTALGSNGPECLVTVVEEIVDADERLDAAPARGVVKSAAPSVQTGIREPTCGRRRSTLQNKVLDRS
jgi:hypothetical protein